ncbi:MAG: hypothetical protein LWY06_16200 [Firmicutes bacterium]|nr:hypothetical protein [Bacillota bacterium]
MKIGDGSDYQSNLKPGGNFSFSKPQGVHPEMKQEDTVSLNSSKGSKGFTLLPLATSIYLQGQKINEAIGGAISDIRKNTAKAYAESSSNFTNIPFPTTIEPFSEEERNKALSVLKPGDIILQKDERSIIMQTLSKVSTGSDYVHAAIYKGDGKILESVAQGVREADADIYLKGQSSVEIIRPPYKTPEDAQAAISFAQDMVGKPYNIFFKTGDEKSFYCTDLVRQALFNMPNPIIPATVDGKQPKIIGADYFRHIEGSEVVYSKGGSYDSSIKAFLPYINSFVKSAIMISSIATPGFPGLMSSGQLEIVKHAYAEYYGQQQ